MDLNELEERFHGIEQGLETLGEFSTDDDSYQDILASVTEKLAELKSYVIEGTVNG